MKNKEGCILSEFEKRETVRYLNLIASHLASAVKEGADGGPGSHIFCALGYNDMALNMVEGEVDEETLEQIRRMVEEAVE